MSRASARTVLPEFHERTSLGERVTDPYAKLLDERVIMLGTPIDETSAQDVIAQLLLLEHRAPDRDIALYVNSPGGSFTAMTAIYDTLRFVSCDIETVCLGQAGPAAAPLLAAGTPGKRAVLPGARVLLRQPAAEEPIRGTASDLAVHAGEFGRLRALVEEILVRHTGRTPDRVSADLDHATVLDAHQAVEYGVVDRITPARATFRRAPGAR
ncbi:ATP-dependent Clp protease proteolytic subunit [Streptomyces tagetis]|uniref:ATP-dependent Clp protease proteolytic subunit n=1 Tax=Streptomyces tagetis TaxID=2820809 RepID=A0A941B3N6_9ACTN|nr:ATP-dependent Clp protease proteolytic subunit [Streptomyces sp. RG38]MBQ0830560.1 ATP-dependent Clp protease proteolytic subunit [Streptomyces sp. RG38]